jgi:hypothetical protein
VSEHSPIRTACAARAAVHSLLVHGKIVVYPEAEPSGVTSTIGFLELGTEQLNLAGIRRSVAHLPPDRRTAVPSERFVGRGDRI